MQDLIDDDCACYRLVCWVFKNICHLTDSYMMLYNSIVTGITKFVSKLQLILQPSGCNFEFYIWLFLVEIKIVVVFACKILKEYYIISFLVIKCTDCRVIKVFIYTEKTSERIGFNVDIESQVPYFDSRISNLKSWMNFLGFRNTTKYYM